MSQSSSSNNKIGKDDVVKICPICKAAVRFFFINFTEKVLLCENEFCNFPLGYETLQYITVDTGINLGASSSSKDNNFESSFVKSCLTSSDIAQLNEIFESTKNELLEVKVTNPKRKKRPDRRITNNKEIKKNLQDLKYFAMGLNETDYLTDDSDFIKNEKWLKKLMKLQGLSRMKLVKKEEMKLIKQETPAFGGGELKIDIDSNKNDSSSINIQITNTDGDRTTLEDVT